MRSICGGPARCGGGARPRRGGGRRVERVGLHTEEDTYEHAVERCADVRLVEVRNDRHLPPANLTLTLVALVRFVLVIPKAKAQLKAPDRVLDIARATTPLKPFPQPLHSPPQLPTPSSTPLTQILGAFRRLETRESRLTNLMPSLAPTSSVAAACPRGHNTTSPSKPRTPTANPRARLLPSPRARTRGLDLVRN